MATKYMVLANALTGGADGALDAWDCTSMPDGSLAIVDTGSIVYHYTYDSGSSTAESAPDVIAPDTGTGRWLLSSAQSKYDVGENLLTNSGFGVWSNSTLENVGTATLEDDCADDDTGDWTTDGSLAFDTDHYEFTADDSGDMMYSADISASLTAGKLYKASITVKDGTQASGVIEFGMLDSSQAANHVKSITTTSSDVTHTLVFTADADDVHLGLIAGADWDANIEIKDISLYETTPGCLSNVYAPDGWYNNTSLGYLYREHDGDNTKDGSFYSLKFIKEDATTESIMWPKSNQWSTEAHYMKFRGRTVAFGAWVKASDANNARIGFYDGTWTYSDYHTGGGDWEWLEISYTVGTAITRFNAAFLCDGDASDIAYFSQPMLVFGSVIGEGNYSQPPGEVVWCDATNIALNNYTGVSVAANANIDIEAETDGKVPKGFKALNMFLRGSCTTTSKYLQLSSRDIFIMSSVSSGIETDSNWVRDRLGTGQIPIARDDTWSGVYINITGVQVS